MKELKKPYKILAFNLGFTSIIVQLVLLREFLTLFMGNELVIGVVLALWMLITALGARLGFYVRGRSSLPIMLLSLNFMGLMPLAGTLLSVWMKTIMFAPGELVSLQGILLIGSIGLLPFCFASGMMFTLLAVGTKNDGNKSSIAGIYAIEAIGGLTGGLVFNFIMLHALDSFEILGIILFINLLLATVSAFTNTRKAIGWVLLILSAILIYPLSQTDFDKAVSKMSFPGQEILMQQNTPYGKLVVTENNGQHNLFHNTLLSASDDNIVEREEKMHYALCLHPNPKKVLVLLGGLDGSAWEALKYTDTDVTYIDADHWSLSAAEKYFTTDPYEAGMHIQDDPGYFLNKSSSSYDVIILNGYPPVSIANNRFFTSRMYRLAKDHLKQGGIFSVRLPSFGNYADDHSAWLYSSIYNTLQEHFGNIRIVPGNHTYMIASDHELEGDITTLIQEKGIENEYVSSWYLDDASMQQRASAILNSLQAEAPLNRDFRPIAAYINVQKWLSMFHIPLWLVLVIPVLLLAFIIIRSHPYNIGLLSSGFTASAAEFIFLITFQLVYGYLYEMMGIIIMIFMLGLALGAGFHHRRLSNSKKSFFIIQVLIGIFIGIMPLILNSLITITLSWLPGFIIMILTFVAALLTGMQYRMATKLLQLSRGKVAATTYSADLIGSAIGVFLAAVFMIPLLGIITTGLILMGLNFMSALLIVIKK